MEELIFITKSIGVLKAPGSDGIQAIFYHSQWETISHKIMNVVHNVFIAPQRNGELNENFLTLIHKSDEVANMKQFRAIGLCNASYKIITKMIARRIRDFLTKLACPAQCAFVPKRRSHDNIVVAQEIFHSMRSKKGEERFDDY